MAYRGTRIVWTSPAQRVQFDCTAIPADIVAAVKEAIACHAEGCYTAAAIMIRRSLELLCEAQQATGKDLKARIESLGRVIVVPRPLIEGADRLRLLGNDAAHLEAKTFANIGKEELDVALVFLKKLLETTYQYRELLGRFEQLQVPS